MQFLVGAIEDGGEILVCLGMLAEQAEQLRDLALHRIGRSLGHQLC